MTREVAAAKEECNVDDLPSKQIYNKFEEKSKENGKHQCDHSNSVAEELSNTLDSKLQNEWVTADEKYATRIANGWCLLSSMKATSQSSCTEKLCDFFYFWLGDLLCDILKQHTRLQTIIPQIYTKLNEHGIQCKYEIMDNHVSRDIFKKRKLIFDYLQDYQTIWRALKDSKSGGPSCNTQFDSYLEAAKDAYRKVQANCGSGENPNNKDDFCTNFRDKFEGSDHGDGQDSNNTIPKPSQLQSKALSEEGELPSEEENLDNCFTQKPSADSDASPGPDAFSGAMEGKGGSDGGGSHRKEGEEADASSIVPVAVGSTLAAVALPTIVAFLFYKYKSNFFFLKGNNPPPGGRIKKRFAQSNFDTLTESSSTFDSSEYSTEASTVGSMEEDNSTIHSGPPGRRRKNRTQRNISYQNM